MQLLSCIHQGIDRVGFIAGEQISLLAADGLTARLTDMLESGVPLQSFRDRATEAAALAEVTVRPPVDAGKIICVGFNYRDHSAEAGAADPAYPSLFVRFSSSQVGHQQPIVAPANSGQFDYEGELAVIIGIRGHRVAAVDAFRHVAGYACFAENSVRDFQSHARQATAGKNFLHSGAFGPWLTTTDAVPDPRALTVVTRLNGNIMQQDSVANLVFPIERLIEYITSFTELLPGDVIVTGTPAGVGFLRTPPVWLQPGDTMDVIIDGVGTLTNTVTAEAGA